MAVFAAATVSPTDGAAQSCTKRKEDDLSIKAITSYFSPVGKNVERVLSPPKSNNIMDYFKKTPPTNENIASPLLEQESKANSTTLENSAKPLSRLKWRGKRNNLNNKFKMEETLELEPLIELNNDNDKATVSPQEENCKTSFMSHSDVALTGLTNMEKTLNVRSESSLNTVSYKTEERKMKIEGNVKSNTERLKRRNPKNEMDLFANSTTEVQTKDPCKDTDKQVASVTESENKSLLLIQNSETNVQKTPQLSDNTVTVSFEDFLKSQGENFKQVPKNQRLDNVVASDKTDICQCPQYLPLKKVTVLAQIHSVPPKPLHSQKIASIFVNQKSKAKEQRSPAISETEYIEQMTQKRKSNVVIAEEELELAILESTGPETMKSKCTAEERSQFMKAFRQPGADIVKNGGKRGPGKQKEVEENSSNHKLECGLECEDDSNKKTGNNTLVAYASSTTHSNTEKSDSTKIKNQFKKRKGIVVAKEKDLNINDNQNSNAHGQINRTSPNEKEREFSQKSKGLRRHCRQKKSQSTPEEVMVSQAVIENPPDAVPLQTSTPKTNRSFKNDLYAAEMITEPFDSNSPIRMKFTRINTSEKFTQQNVKMNSISRNIFKAKKLVEKAKAVQHNRISRNVEEGFHVSLRRSSRQRALAEKKILEKKENSDTLDSGTSHLITVSDNIENPKNLQSVNDVLGKKTRIVKAAKKSNGKEKMSSLIRKKVKKSTDEVVILDKSSEDESENSQDDTEFKAKREFLMSGLPESLKRQIAKKAAALEEYFATNSCFQKVIHIQQKDDRCLMWRLAPPSCPLLTKLMDVNSEVTDVAKLTLSLGELSLLNTQPNSRDSEVIVLSGWRPVLSKIQRSVLLDEIQSSNTQFPVKLFFDLLLKKQAPPENNKQVNKCETVNSETNTDEVQKEGKRKRKTKDRKCKRKKQKEKSESGLSKNPSQIPRAKPTGAENSHIIDMDKVEESEMKTTEGSQFGSENTRLSDFANEDMLWTEKYQPQNSSELIGNAEAIRKLHRWLCEWKRKADWEENRNQKEKRNGSKDADSLESLDFIDNASVSDEENLLCNTMLLIGPPGIGKTAAVYACARELGFKIFEVNASCQRSGRQILSQLKEATQSHQVNKQGVHAHKPCFFNHYGSTKSPKKQSPRKEWSPRKLPVSPRRVGLKQGLMPQTLDNYFKITSKLKNKEEKVQRSNKENRKSLAAKKPQIKSGKKRNKEEESSKNCATSLILFEEVDVIFDEDVGFLNAIKTFMSTTKRPVILTTNDPLFGETFDGCFEQITFSVPSLINVASYLQVLCLAENLRTDIRDFAALLTVNNCDIRQSILHLQFWVQSGGGDLKEKGKSTEINGTEQNASIKESTSSKSRKPVPENIPKCSTGCIENLLGLKNIFLPSEDLFSFLKHEIRTKEDWNKLIHLLTEFQMRNTDFIYNNLEIMSSLPLNIIPEAIEIASPACSFIAEKSSNSTCIDTDYLEEAPPVKKAKRSRCQKKIAVLEDSDLFESEFNYSGFVTLLPDTTSSCLEEKGMVEPMNVGTAALKNGTSANTKDSVLVFQCLNSLIEFLDNMSFLDSCFTGPTQASEQPGKYEEFIWTKGKIKNGLSDEFSVEYTDWCSSQSSSELKATMEAFSFNKCSKNTSKIMESCLNCSKPLGKKECEKLTLHVSKERADLYFGQSAANSSIHCNAQKRIEVIKTVFSGIPLSLNSRQASVIEYLPILRNICKSEKQKEQGKTKRRFLHYLEGIHLPKEILNSLATDFP